MNAHSPAAVPPRRRWYQFSLRTMLIGMSLIGCVCGWTLVKIDRAKKQQAAVKLGGVYGYDYQKNAARTHDEPPQPPAPAWLRNWVGDDLFVSVDTACLAGTWTDQNAYLLQSLPQLKSLKLGYSKIGDQGMANIEGLTKLNSLVVGRTVTNDGLRHIAQLRQLHFLSLDRTQVSDAGLQHLRLLTQLQTLRLDKTAVTGSGLGELQPLAQLADLSLAKSALDDAGLERIATLRSLKQLNIKETQVTPAAVERLQRALPNCEITY